ncbi:Serine/threonine-protein kinase D6PKL2 [Hibiscus syriacus]|uniref:non-specific serine/threonine protein kinase n=1 Tax=Hibiscus syriacus TaxID=106335 RepID=A0A6A3AR27_HIBSY|nr:serine/threonine-protein kinase D6PKL1-like [Hibiscus syriacus]KAE8705807.1 Serine/threonine-protein kinase D6PKL2 [Hibiscus syriacus]
MEPWLDDLADDLQSLSFTSCSSAAVNRSTSSGSASNSGSSSLSPSAHGSFSSKHLRSCTLSLADLNFSLRLGSGDIGSVYLAELKSPAPLPPDPNAVDTNENNSDDNSRRSQVVFAAKVMDKKELASRSKEGRARTEVEILKLLDHPFLPSLYAAIDSPRWLCLLTEFCPGGDLHILRQRQPLKRFSESSVRFYASEMVVALEYLHMLGIVYRDLKPENVLVRADGHIMLTDFDLSLKCDDSTSTPQVILDRKPSFQAPQTKNTIDQPSSCMIPNCIVPAVSCFHPKRKRKRKTVHRGGPEFVAEPIDVRSMSFVGTHEYLAPEIVSGEGHGSPVDWWTVGVIMFELFYGVTPFKGVDHELTLANIVARALEFPKEPAVAAAAKDLMLQLLVKDPARRLGSTMGASAIKHHPFFQGINWALLRCTTPPYVPPPFRRVSDESCPATPVDYY